MIVIKNFKYGARAPEQSEHISDQMHLAHRYYNTLIEIEREKRVAIRGIPEDASKEMRKRQLDAIKQVVNGRIRAARRDCGVYWGTYLLVEAAAQDAARKTPLSKDPRFAAWHATKRHRVGIQLQGGLSVEDSFSGTDTRLRIEQIADSPRRTPGSRRAGQRYRVHLRVGTVEGKRDPIWASFDCILHRPLPAGGTVKWAWAQRTRFATSERWDVVFTVDYDADAYRQQQGKAKLSPPKNIVAINFGWRVRQEGLRVAYWVDDEDGHGELTIPEHYFLSLDHIQELRSVRQRLFNEFRERLQVMLSAVALPEWFLEETRTLGQWRSPDRLWRLIRRWGRERFTGDKTIYPTGDDCPRDANGALDCTAHAQCWARKDKHLHEWATRRHRKLLGERKDLYQCWAAMFARSYKRIVLDDFNMMGVQGRKLLDENATDAEKVVADNVSSRRHAAAVGQFREAVVNAAGKARVEKQSCKCKTITCCHCGHVDPWTERHLVPPVDHCCVECGSTWDQDHNHALLHRREAESSGPAVPEPPEALEGGMSAKQKAFREAKERKRKKKAAEKVLKEHGSKMVVEGAEISEDQGTTVETLAQLEEN